MIHLYYGDGKGKTTAAIGLLVRAAGNGFQTYFCQFMKGNPSGELNILQKLDFVTILRPKKDYPFYKNMTEAEKQEITEEHDRILDALLALPDTEKTLIVLDELTYPLSYGLIDPAKVERLLEGKTTTEIVMTGRDPQNFLLKKASYKTEMKKITHPFDAGLTARAGIEF